MQNKIIGNFGEDLAVNFLKKQGYKILERNLKLSYKELDIIAKIKKKIIFVEVKTRTSKFLGPPEYEINAKKLHHLKKAISMYVNNKKNIDPNDIRLDLIAITIDKNTKTAKIKHYKDIF